MNDFISHINDFDFNIQKRDFNDILELILGKEGVTNREVSVVFVDNEEIKKINNDYRGKDYPTDVISFAFDDSGFVSVALGDIIISVDKAKEQAKAYNHSFRREMAFLYCHGLLHLLGYSHGDVESEKVMFDYQDKVLLELGIGR